MLFLFSPLTYLILNIFKKQKNIILISIGLGLIGLTIYPTGDLKMYFNIIEYLNHSNSNLEYLLKGKLDYIFWVILYVFAKLRINSGFFFMILWSISYYFLFLLIEKVNKKTNIKLKKINMIIILLYLNPLFITRNYLGQVLLAIAIIKYIDKEKNKKIYFLSAFFTHISTMFILIGALCRKTNYFFKIILIIGFVTIVELLFRNIGREIYLKGDFVLRNDLIKGSSLVIILMNMFGNYIYPILLMIFLKQIKIKNKKIFMIKDFILTFGVAALFVSPIFFRRFISLFLLLIIIIVIRSNQKKYIKRIFWLNMLLFFIRIALGLKIIFFSKFYNLLLPFPIVFFDLFSKSEIIKILKEW